MNIKAEIKRTFEDKGKLKAVANLVFDNEFIVKNVRLVDGVKGPFVSMPSNKMNDGSFVEVCHPIRSNVKKQIEECVIEAYHKAIVIKNAEDEKTE